MKALMGWARHRLRALRAIQMKQWKKPSRHVGRLMDMASVDVGISVSVI